MAELKRGGCRILLAVFALALAACADPVRAIRVDPKIVHGDLAQSAVTTGDPSLATRNALFELGLFDRFDESPEATLAELHRAMVASGGVPDLLFALAELSFLHGDVAKKRDYQMAAVVYAYAFLFPEGTGVSSRAIRPSRPDGCRRVQPGSDDGVRVRGRVGGYSARWHLHAAIRADRSRLRSRLSPRRGPRAVPAHPGIGAADRGVRDAVPLAGARRPARRIEPAHRRLATRSRHGGAAAPGAAHRPSPDSIGAAPSGAGAAAQRLAGGPPRLGCGVGLHCRGASPSRERAVGGAGAHVHRHSDPRAGDARAPGPAQRGDAGTTPPRLRDAVPSWAHPGRLRARHGFERRSMGADVQPSGRRSRGPQPLPVLVLPVRLGQPDRAVGVPPA